jgi:hypothetical protein
MKEWSDRDFPHNFSPPQNWLKCEPKSRTVIILSSHRRWSDMDGGFGYTPATFAWR